MNFRDRGIERIVINQRPHLNGVLSDQILWNMSWGLSHSFTKLLCNISLSGLHSERKAPCTSTAPRQSLQNGRVVIEGSHDAGLLFLQLQRGPVAFMSFQSPSSMHIVR